MMKKCCHGLAQLLNSNESKCEKKQRHSHAWMINNMQAAAVAPSPDHRQLGTQHPLQAKYTTSPARGIGESVRIVATVAV